MFWLQMRYVRKVDRVDQFTQADYQLTFRCAFLEKRGEAFQDFFSSIMDKRYPGDFIRTRPWGNQGDRENDGYLRSTRTLFQVYGPIRELLSPQAVGADWTIVQDAVTSSSAN